MSEPSERTKIDAEPGPKREKKRMVNVIIIIIIIARLGYIQMHRCMLTYRVNPIC